MHVIYKCRSNRSRRGKSLDQTASFRVPFIIGMSSRACATICNVSINDYHDGYGCR